MSEPEPIHPARFGVEGYLEPGFHHWNTASIGFHFVEQMPHSTTRSVLWKGFAELQACFAALGLTVEHWIDGSFTTMKADPRDIDVASFFDPDQVAELTEAHQRMLRAYVSGSITRNICHCDSYFAMKVPEDHPLREEFETAYNYWLEKFGSDRHDVPKGIVVTQFVPPTPPTPEDDDTHESHADAA